MKWTGIAVAAACMVWGGLAAGTARADVQAGVDAYNAGDYKRAIDEWMPAAAQNDPTALFNLGQVYRLGKGVEPDFAVAEDYYKRAAALGHVIAEGNLGALYLDTNGPLFDPKAGVAWLQRAAYGGNMLSRYMLGVVYFNGQYVPTDYVEAYAWISLAAGQGLPDAVKAEQTIASQMALQEISKGKARADALAQESEKVMAGEATERKSQTPVAEPARQEAAPVREAAADARTGAWIDPDEQRGSGSPASAATVGARPASGGDTPISGFGIQLASLKSEGSARSTWMSLVAAHPDLLGGLAPYVERADLGPEKGVFYRLQAGSLPSLATARDLCGKLKDLGVGCLPISR
jgi:uncharacterized protein